ncbi:MAG: response regulator transcription factor [Candidatus Daviesbacteria bacterium]|nr:response regulator transcription factor [Candidatus Daviesbacteria bacterium]
MNKKILLIEDDYFINQLYMKILKDNDFEVILASDGEEGVRLADKSFNLILLDIMLPKLDGIKVLKKLKENPDTKNIPIILVTNLGQKDVVKQAFDLGAQGYLLKMSMTPYQLIEKIKPFLEDPSFQMDLKELDLD